MQIRKSEQYPVTAGSDCLTYECDGQSKVTSLYIKMETHYVFATKPNRLMLFGKTVAVYCENHTEHTNTLCGQNVEF
jgi:hypothetical protein